MEFPLWCPAPLFAVLGRKLCNTDSGAFYARILTKHRFGSSWLRSLSFVWCPLKVCC